MKSPSTKTISLFSVFLLLAVFNPTGSFAVTPVKGFADIHTHQMAEYAYAGAWFWGSHVGKESQAMKKCNGGSILGGDHARTKIPLLNEFIGKGKLGTVSDVGVHYGKRYGYPTYSGWPRWDTIAHQQMWEGHLKQAYKSGLRLYVVSAVDFKPLCNLMPEKNKKFNFSCNEMVGATRQLDAALAFAKKNRKWIEIAKSPQEARDIINRNKLAMILAIEVTDLFDNNDWQESLNYYYDRYHVRSIQIGHQLNNRFGGVAPHHLIFKVFQIIRSLGLGDFRMDHYNYLFNNNIKNPIGLTKEGKKFAKAMMKKHMIMDIAHMSEKAVDDLYGIAVKTNYYPMVLSHGHFRSIMTDKKQKEEKTTPDEHIRYIRETGGMVGLRTGEELTKEYAFSGVDNDCDGSTKSFAQAYQYGVKGLKVPIAFASDFNGFIQQLRPRFGNNTESCGSSNDKKIIQKQIKKQKKRLVDKNGKYSELNYQGFAHIGLEYDIIRELKNFGVDTTGLENSAETFIRVWERCYDDNRKALPTDDMDVSGIK